MSRPREGTQRETVAKRAGREDWRTQRAQYRHQGVAGPNPAVPTTLFSPSAPRQFASLFAHSLAVCV
jgi:hypothetical protein